MVNVAGVNNLKYFLTLGNYHLNQQNQLFEEKECPPLSWFDLQHLQLLSFPSMKSKHKQQPNIQASH